MNIKVIDQDCHIESFSMPDGVLHTKLNCGLGQYPMTTAQVIQINHRITDGDSILELGYIVDILRREYGNTKVPINLNLLYISAQRMDRPISEREPNSLKVYASFINSLNLNSVTLHCPHSDVLQAVINNCRVSKSEYQFFKSSIETCKFYYNNYYHDENNFSIVIPDIGAMKRFGKKEYLEIFGALKVSDSIVIAEKKRDMATGKLSGFKVLEGKPKSHCLILDDLCDGGGTFSGLAKVLVEEHQVKNVELAAFHGLFSKGLPISNIGMVYTTDSFCDTETMRAKFPEVAGKNYLKVYSL